MSREEVQEILRGIAREEINHTKKGIQNKQLIYHQVLLKSLPDYTRFFNENTND